MGCAAKGGIVESSRPSGSSNAASRASAAASRSARTSTNGRSEVVAPMKRGPGACHNCDDPNHESRDCPKPCRECGSDKHRIGYHYRNGAKVATASVRSSGGGASLFRPGVKASQCFNCQDFGHESRDCPKPCGICGSTQHKGGYHLNDHLYENKSGSSGDRRRVNGRGAGSAGAPRSTKTS